MRLHTNTLSYGDVVNAALGAHADWTIEQHGSRSRCHSFDVHLAGHSNRRPNFWDGNEAVFAATWDQWGVFFASLYRMDPHMVAGGTKKRPHYANNTDFGLKTFGRFRDPGFPSDYHGDHTFRWASTNFVQACTKCSAMYRWNIPS